MNIRQLQALAASVGFPPPSVATAAAVAMAESGGNPQAVGDLSVSPGGSVGLWQVNLASHRSYTREALLDPVFNARAALAISSGGRNWNPWTTYRTGVYRRFLLPYTPPEETTVEAMWLAGGIVTAAVGVAWWITR